jgi:hypothetical protein
MASSNAEARSAASSPRAVWSRIVSRPERRSCARSAGYARLTVDVDVIVARNAENLRRLLDVLAQWGEGFARELSPADFIGEEGCVRVSEEFDLDIFTTMSGRTLDDFRPRLRYLNSAGRRIPYISPEDIISLKQSSWRDKDQLDVRAMRQAIAREEQ